MGVWGFFKFLDFSAKNIWHFLKTDCYRCYQSSWKTHPSFRTWIKKQVYLCSPEMCFLKSVAKVFADEFCHSIHKYCHTRGRSFSHTVLNTLTCHGMWLCLQGCGDVHPQWAATANSGPVFCSQTLKKPGEKVASGTYWSFSSSSALFFSLTHCADSSCQVGMKAVDRVDLVLV